MSHKHSQNAEENTAKFKTFSAISSFSEIKSILYVYLY